MKGIIFIKDKNKYFVMEESVFGFRDEVLNIDKVKNVITKVCSKNNYITFRNGNIIKQSIIIKIDSNDSKKINETNEFLLNFTEEKYPNIDYSTIKY
jgi:hypothetical protein